MGAMTGTALDAATGLPIGGPLTADGMLAGLDPEQREVALALDGPVCVLAGAGAGKTPAITHRIAYRAPAGVYTPQQGPAPTFTPPPARGKGAPPRGPRRGGGPGP